MTVPFPPEGSYYHGVYPGGRTGYEDDITPADVESYERSVGRRAVWVYFSHNWFNGRGFPAETSKWIRERGSIPFIRLMLRSSAEQNEWGSPNKETLYTLEAINRGDFDEDLRQWGRDAAAFGSPLLVEWGTEMNGFWFPWNGYWVEGEDKSRGPELFKDAFRRIVEMIREQGGARNVTWVFHANNSDDPEPEGDYEWNRMENYYPGDEYVDWLGISVYGAQVPTEDVPCLPFSEGMAAGIEQLVRLASPPYRHKPVFVLEFGATGNHPGDDPQCRPDRWAQGALRALLANRWPQVRGFSWWNETWENDEGVPDTDMRVQSVPGLSDVFRHFLAGGNVIDRPITGDTPEPAWVRGAFRDESSGRGEHETAFAREADGEKDGDGGEVKLIENEALMIEGRARWFARRAGELVNAASLTRLVSALEQAEEVPADARDAVPLSLEGRPLLHAYYEASDAERGAATLLDSEGRRASLETAADAAPEEAGMFGPAMSVRELPSGPAMLTLPVSQSDFPDLDLETAVFLRWHDDVQDWSLVEATKYFARDKLLVGRITEPGLYRAVALPRHPFAKLALETMSLHMRWLPEPAAPGGPARSSQAQPDEALDSLRQTLLRQSAALFGAEGARDGVEGEPARPPSGPRLDAFIDSLFGGVAERRSGPSAASPAPPVLRLSRRAGLTNGRWESVGPVPGVNFGGIGRVTQLDIHPTNGNVLVAATSGGGVWRTDDAGLHWRPLMESERTLTMGAVAFAPSDPQVIYAASGEDADVYQPAWPGVGVYRSLDGGSKWESAAAVSSTRFSAIVVHPTRSNVIYVAGNRGLHKSLDGGVTWVTNPGLGSLFDGQVTDVVLAHDEPNRIYIGVKNNGVFRSTTGGETSGATPAFVRLSGANRPPSGAAAGWIKLAIGRNGANGSSFLVAKLGPRGSRIFTTTDKGERWREQAANVAAVDFDEWASLIAVDPSNERRLYAGAAERLQRSDDGGGSWTSILGNVHSDQQDIVFDPANPARIYLANDGGVYLSTNAGGAWHFASGDLAVSQLYDMDVSEVSTDVVACAAQDNGVYYRNQAGVWRHIQWGDGTQTAIDPTDPRIFYFSSQHGVPQFLRRSLDGGLTHEGLGSVGLFGDSPWVTIIKLHPDPLIEDPVGARELFVCGSNTLFRSTDSGGTWQSVDDANGNPFTTDGEITALEYAPGDPSTLYLGTSIGMLYRATGGGVAASDWTRLSWEFPDSQISAVSVDPSDANHVWVVFAGNGVTSLSRPDLVLNPLGISHVFKTTNGGADWVDASGRLPSESLPDVPTSAVVIDNLDRNVAYAGTDVGVFRTSDGGITWTVFQEGLARSPVTELRLQRGTRTLFAATMGRGVYRRRLG